MKARFLILLIIGLIFINPTVGSAELIELNSSHNNIIVNTNTEYFQQTLSYSNQSIIVNNSATLTISESTLNFTGYDNTGIIVDNGSLIVVNSTITMGDKCISGATYGSVIIINSIITGCLGDAIELEGLYHFSMNGSIVDEIGSRGLDFTGPLQGPIQINSTTFTNIGGDGINTYNVELEIRLSSFSNIADEGLQIGGIGSVIFEESYLDTVGKEGIQLDHTGYSMISDTSISNIGAHAVQTSGTNNLTVNSVIVSNIVNDGFNLEAIGFVKILNSQIMDTGDEGIAINFASTVVISDTSIDNSLEDGIELEAITESININNVVSTNSAVDDGLKITNVNDSIIITSSIFNNNAKNGIELVDVNKTFVFDTTMNENELSGIESSNSNDIDISNSITDSNTFGVYVNYTSSIDMDELTISNNDIGIHARATDTVDIHYSVFKTNTILDINATELGTGNSVNASYNYWNTLYVDTIKTEGNVIINPILNSDYEIVTSDDSSSSSNSNTPSTPTSDSDGGFLNVFVPFTILVVPVIFRRRN